MDYPHYTLLLVTPTDIVKNRASNVYTTSIFGKIITIKNHIISNKIVDYTHYSYWNFMFLNNYEKQWSSMIYSKIIYSMVSLCLTDQKEIANLSRRIIENKWFASQKS